MKTLAAPPAQSLVQSELKASAERLQSAKEARIRAIRLGRSAGLTWVKIGEQLGISDAACIQLLQRADSGK